MSEPRIEIVDLGTWGAVELLAEYDPEDNAIRVNRNAVERLRATTGDAEAARFVACAVAHERYHRAHPHASEPEAQRHAREVSGFDARCLARITPASNASYATGSSS